MNALPIVGAGLSFAGAVLVGLVAGILAAQRTGHPLWVPVGLFAGFFVGFVAAIRLVVRSK